MTGARSALSPTAFLQTVVLGLALLQGEVVRARPTDGVFEPLLFMDLNDVADGWGLLEPVASTVAPSDRLAPPPLAYDMGSLVIAVIESTHQPGTFEVYAENTTGWEPLGAARPSVSPAIGGYHDCTLLRFTTTDFVNYSPPHVALSVPGCAGTPTMKSVAATPDGGLYVMFTVGGPPPGLHSFVSTDHGLSWTAANTTGVAPPDKDDLNIIFSKGRFVDMQIVWQNHSLRWCDNGGCDVRRVVSSKHSADGAAWSADAQPFITPDAADPPDLQFYRCRPFYIGATSRIAAHTLLYAPAPPQRIMGTAYGRQPSMCDGTPPNRFCHGPHLYGEWWIGPADGDAANTSGWRRSHRRTHATPRDAFLMAQPVGLGDELVWVGSGRVYTLPMFRIAGIYAPANGEFSTAAFTVPAAPVWVNANVSWHGRLNTSYDGVQGCDEGCAAYLFAAVLDADTGDELAGYGVNETVVKMGTDGLHLVLQWRGAKGGEVVDTTPLVGKRVRLRIYFRDATVYAVGA